MQNEQTPALIDMLTEARDFIDRYSDVNDGSYGVPEPNDAMVMVHEINATLEQVPSPASSSSVVQGDESGVERAHGPKCWGTTSFSDEVAHCYCGPSEDRPQPSGETRDCPHGLHSVGSCSDCSVNRSMDDQPHAPVSRPAGEGEREAVAREDAEVLAMLDDYAERYIGATRGEDMSLEEMLISKARERLSLLSPAAPDAGGGWMPIETAPKDGTEILVAPHMTVVAWDFGAEQWVVGIIPLNRDRTIADDWTVQPAMMFEQYLSNWGVEPTHWMPLPAPPALQPGGER